MTSLRNTFIAKAFAIKKSRGLTDEDFNDLKYAATGLESIRAMNDAQLKKFVQTLDMLKPARKADPRPATERRCSEAQRAKIWKMMYLMKWQPENLASYITKMTGKDLTEPEKSKIILEWLTAQEAYQIIEALCAMAERRPNDSGFNPETRHQAAKDR